ncbi:MAG: ABC transporter substrate-binding protein [Bacteroidia bacterium]|nr:ABC transporter substrate-binding protein [Bacteroidia bacterium]
MPVFIDQLHRKLEINSLPKRIISLVPSQTELLYDLGLRDEVVGITKFCIHPDEWFRTKERVGGTKKLDFEKIKQLQPDLIIGNKEENEQVQIEELMKHYTVWMSDIYTLKDALDMITCVGNLIGKQKEAIYLKLEIESKFNAFKFEQSTVNRQTSFKTKTAYFIWNKPFMVAGNTTFINEMLIVCGLENVFLNKASRYPEVSVEEIKAANPDVILLSSEPYPFKEKHIQEMQHVCPSAKIQIVDGELFSWYGSRLLKSPAYFSELIKMLE